MRRRHATGVARGEVVRYLAPFREEEGAWCVVRLDRSLRDGRPLFYLWARRIHQFLEIIDDPLLKGALPATLGTLQHLRFPVVVIPEVCRHIVNGWLETSMGIMVVKKTGCSIWPHVHHVLVAHPLAIPPSRGNPLLARSPATSAL